MRRTIDRLAPRAAGRAFWPGRPARRPRCRLHAAACIALSCWPLPAAGRRRRRRACPVSPPRATTFRRRISPASSAITRPATDFSKSEQFELMQGGAGTSRKRVNQDAFSQSSANITFEEEGTFKLGNGMFRKVWVSAPSSTQASDGLGPLFNARACQSCHLKDGRGHPPEGIADATSMFLRLARAGRDGRGEGGGRRPARCSTSPTRSMAGSCRTSPCRGSPAKAGWRSPTRNMPVTLGDGTRVSLRKPSYSVDQPRLRPARSGDDAVAARDAADDRPRPGRADPSGRHPGACRSRRPRRRRHFGQGLDRARRQERRADARPLRLEGVRRRRSASRRPTPSPATSASRRRKCRNTGATAPRRKRLASPCRTACRSGWATVEAPDPVMDLVTFYSQNLAVPARRDIDKPDVLARQAAVLRKRLRLLPHAEIRDPPRRAQQGAVLPADLALFRLPAARHGRRARRRAAGRRRDRQRMAHRRRCGASG